MRVTICGPPGSGKSKVAKLISKKFNLKHLSMGDMRREYAKSKGITIDELNKLGEIDSSTDENVDKFQTKYGKENNNFIIDGRLSFHFIPNSIKLFIDVETKEAARRIFNANRDSEKTYSSQDEVLNYITSRVESDRKRYGKYYGIDCYDKKHFDYVIDTTNKSIEQVQKEVENILIEYQRKGDHSS